MLYIRHRCCMSIGIFNLNCVALLPILPLLLVLLGFLLPVEITIILDRIVAPKPLSLPHIYIGKTYEILIKLSMVRSLLISNV